MQELLKDKVVYIIPTGAHKTIYIEDLLKSVKELGADMWVMPTPMATKIITDYESLRVLYKVKDNYSSENSWIVPEEDIVVVAPCTFNTFNKIALGIADNYPMSVIHNAIGKNVKVIIAPAMDYSLWNNFTARESLVKLQNQRNISVIFPEYIYNGMELEKITMAPYSKILDGIVRNFVTIRYDHNQVGTNIDEIQKKYIGEFYEVGKKLADEKYLVGSAGFLAKRISEGILTTVTGASVGNLKKDDLALVVSDNSNTVYWKGTNCPTSEYPIVSEIFNRFSDANVIIHGHCKDVTYNPVNAKYTTMNYIPFGTWNGIDEVYPLLVKHDGFAIMKLHGEIIVAKNFDEAYNMYKEKRNGDK